MPSSLFFYFKLWIQSFPQQMRSLDAPGTALWNGCRRSLLTASVSRKGRGPSWRVQHSASASDLGLGSWLALSFT